MKRFYASRDGNIAIMTALLMMPMIGVASIALDYSYAARNKDRVDSAALIAATAAANTARNYLDLTGSTAASRSEADFASNTENNTDTNAITEGQRVGSASLSAQIGVIPRLTLAASNVTVKRIGNTINARVTYSVSQPTLLMSIFRIPNISYSGEGTMIVGLQDTKTSNFTLDEQWSKDQLTNTYSLPSDSSAPILKDWLASTGRTGVKIGPPPIDEADLGTTLNTNSTVRTAVGPAALTIGDNQNDNTSISKKIFFPAGVYELTYWYKSTVIYDEYEPVYICGTDVREWDWATATDWRTVAGGSGSSSLASLGAVYLDPVTTNPQTAERAPQTFSSTNMIDGCAYSARWIQRTVLFKVVNAGYFWLSFVSVFSRGTTSQGFYLGTVKLCSGSNCSGTPYNNSPWKSQPVELTKDSFENVRRVADGADFDLSTMFGYTHPLYLSPVAGWNVRTRSITNTTQADGTVVSTTSLSYPFSWTPGSGTAPIVSRTGQPTVDGVSVVEFKNPNISLTRTLLLLPGVYKLTLNMVSLPRAPTYSCADTDEMPIYTPNYFRTDYPNYGAYGGSLPSALSNDAVNVERGLLANNLFNTCQSNGTFKPEFLNTLCFLVPRTQFYDVGPYIREVAGYRLDDMRVTLLTSKITDPTRPVDNDWDPRRTPGPQAALTSTPACRGNIKAVVGGIVAWPSFGYFYRANSRIIVTQSPYP